MPHEKIVSTSLIKQPTDELSTPSFSRPIEVRLETAAQAVSETLLRTHAQYRVAVAQITTDPGNIVANTKKIIGYIEEARSKKVDLVVFPELAIPGYCSMDLLWDKDYLAANLAALQQIREASRGITVIVGFVDVDPHTTQSGGRPTLYNSAAILRDGELLGVQDKTLLPNYDIFFEDRYFAPPRGSQVFQAGALKVGAEICEDLWTAGYSLDPAQALVEKGADVVVNLSASPFQLGKLPLRHKLVSETAQAKKVPLVYANLVGSFDGFEGEVVFDGRSMIVGAAGNIVEMAQGFKEQLLISDVFAEKEMPLPEIAEVEELHDALVLGIKDYFRRIAGLEGADIRCAYIGLSGGIDSAVVAALAVEALGSDTVIGITLPSRYNSDETKSDARALAENLGIRFKTLSIEKQFQSCVETFAEDSELAALPEGVAEQNIQARLRMLDLMYYANKTHGIVLNTGNKTELALDNCTIYGDMVGGFSVLGDVDKDRVYALARYINERAGRELIPTSTIERIPTAELKPNQQDSDVMGADPALIAPMVRSIIEEGLSMSEALNRFGAEWGEPLIRRTLQRIDRSEWKRRQAAPAIRVTSHAFGNGRRMPMSHGLYRQQKQGE
jgi:NAD+ synthase (glutamine-hydrolysing)